MFLYKNRSSVPIKMYKIRVKKNIYICQCILNPFKRLNKKEVLENCAPCGVFYCLYPLRVGGELASLYKKGEVFEENL